MSHLLKVTRFLVKISQFKVLVMTDKKFCVYKLFLSLNILLKFIFHVKTATSLKKTTPSFQANPCKNQVSLKPATPPPLPTPHFENLARGSTLQQKERDEHCLTKSYTKS